MEYIFFQRRYTNANRYVQRCCASLTIGKVELKTTRRYHLTPIRMTVIKTTTSDDDRKKKEPLCTFGGNVNWYSYCERNCRSSSEILKIELPYGQKFHF